MAIVAISASLTAMLVPSLVATDTWFYLPFFALGALYGAFNVVIFLGAGAHAKKPPPRQSLADLPKVALLYTTCNDFQEAALRSLLDVQYPAKEIVILDDGTDPHDRQAIDAIASQQGLVVLRRGHRRGFKAGAINDALPHVDADFIGIFDADEIVPRDFVERALEYMTSDRVAFVQASHYAYNRTTRWTKAMGHGVDLHWRFFQAYRNRFGVVNFLGHGALLRARAIWDVGGFPEIVSEDIALTVELARRGYHGVFADDLLCGETFPETYAAFRRRHRKWAMGTADFFRRYLAKIVTAPLPWYGKLDLLLPTLGLPMTLLLFLFVVATAFAPPPITVPLAVVTALAVISPLLPFLTLPRRERWPTIVINTIAFMSLFSISVAYILRGALGRSKFPVTGDPRSGRGDLDTSYDVAMGLVLLAIGPISALGLVAIVTPVLKWLFDRPAEGRERDLNSRQGIHSPLA